jgi:hypothetical protein
VGFTDLTKARPIRLFTEPSRSLLG